MMSWLIPEARNAGIDSRRRWRAVDWSIQFSASFPSDLSSFSKTKIASTRRAGNAYTSLAPNSFQTWNSSIIAMLSDVIYDVGQLDTATVFRAQITGGDARSSCLSQPHRRFFSKPLARHVSHFQAAWLAN